MRKLNKKHSCKCKDLTIIFLNNGDPFISKLGAHNASDIKEILGLPSHETLYEVIKGSCPVEHDDSKKVVIKGCETFYSVPPGAGNSKETIEKELLEEPYEGTFGIKPKLLREAGNYILLFEGLTIDEAQQKVDVALEWPKKNRLLFSEKITTPKCQKLNWAQNYSNIRLCGRLWQGVSLKTTESTPFKVLLSYLRALI